MQSRITGTTMPVLEIGLEPGETVVAEPGELAWMTPNVQMNTTTQTAGAGGFFGAVARAFGGGGLFMTEFSTAGGQGAVAFAAKVPGAIVQIDVQPGRTFMIHRHGFMCGTAGAMLGAGFQRSLGAGIFGGEGFVLQRLSGPCTAWVALGGENITYDLQPGEALRVHPGHVGMFEDSVKFDITMIRGIRNALFGGDGLFLAELTGPGKIWLQSLTVPGLAHAIGPYLGRGDQPAQTAQTAVEAGVAGAVLRNIFGRS
jgi:uncharacterized protein (TIGR00266 family)